MPHAFQMPQKYIDTMVARMGREHSQETFETEKTALVVVDMQNVSRRVVRWVRPSSAT